MSQNNLSQEPSTDRPARQKKSLEDYEFLINENAKVKTSDLGKGSYGSVKKVREKSTGEIFAMKILTKKSIFAYATKENLKREISIQKSITHPNIIKLYHYFEDKENVYLVLEFAENGTLFQYLRKRRKLGEQEAFIYFLQTCLGIDYLHKRKILHRDLKPENLLLNKDSNIKLCDFGWSAENHSKRHTFCGTVDYMAPEMVKNQPYDHKLDIWCLGVLLFEILHGDAPFKGKSDTEKCRKIAQNAVIEFSPEISKDAVDLIRKILRPNPSERLSMDEIFTHPWMRRYEQEYNMSIQSLIREQDELVKDAQVAFQRAEKAKTLTFDKNQPQSNRVEESYSYESTEKNSTDYSKGSKSNTLEDTTSYGSYDNKSKNYSNASTKTKDPYSSYESGKEYKPSQKSDSSSGYSKYSDFAKLHQKVDNNSYGSDLSYKKATDYSSSIASNAYKKPEETAYSYQSYPSQNREQEKSSAQKADNVFFKFLNSNPSQTTKFSDIDTSYPTEPYSKKPTTDYTSHQSYQNNQSHQSNQSNQSNLSRQMTEKKADYVQSYEPYLNKPKEIEKSSSFNIPQQTDNVFFKLLQGGNNQMSKLGEEPSSDYTTYKATTTSSMAGTDAKPAATSKDNIIAAYEESYNNYFKNKEALQRERTKKFPQDQNSPITTSPPPISQETQLRSYSPEKPAWQDTKTSQVSGYSHSPYTSDKPAWMESSRITAEKASYNAYDYENLRPEDSTYKKPTLYVNQYQSNQDDIDNYLAKHNLLQKKQSMPLDDISGISRPYYDSYGQDYNNVGARSRSFDDKEFRRKKSLQKGEKEKKSRNVDYNRGEKYNRTIEEEYDDYDQEYRQKKKGRGKKKQKENEPNFIERLLIGIGCITRGEKEQQ